MKAVITKVQSGEADAGLVYVTDVQPRRTAPSTASISPAPSAWPTRYPIAVLKDARESGGGEGVRRVGAVGEGADDPGEVRIRHAVTRAVAGDAVGAGGAAARVGTSSRSTIPRALYLPALVGLALLDACPSSVW